MKFPKDLFVKIEKTDADEWFNAQATLPSLVEMGERSKIARYQLVEITEAEGVVSQSKPRR